MKNLFALLALVLTLTGSFAAQAQTIHRVNNSGLPINGVNIYSTLQDAHDAASAGDIIYLEPTDNSYGNLTCTKQLTIIGNGYFLDQNPTLKLDERDARVGTINLASGSDGSRITGCVVQGNFFVAVGDVTIERNHTNTIFLGYNSGFSVGGNNVIVRQNYITSTVYLYSGSTAATALSNVNITNNIILGSINAQSNSVQLNNVLIANNVVGNLAGTTAAGIRVENAVIKNNILTYTGTISNFTPNNNSYSYNISGNSAFGTANGNQQNIAPTSLFVGGTASTDGAFQLSAGSPASGAGESGTDVGAFGGTTPYRIAGIPNVPSIYEYNQSVSGNSLNATISTRSNN